MPQSQPVLIKEGGLTPSEDKEKRHAQGKGRRDSPETHRAKASYTGRPHFKANGQTDTNTCPKVFIPHECQRKSVAAIKNLQSLPPFGHSVQSVFSGTLGTAQLLSSAKEFSGKMAAAQIPTSQERQFSFLPYFFLISSCLDFISALLKNTEKLSSIKL